MGSAIEIDRLPPVQPSNERRSSSVNTIAAQLGQSIGYARINGVAPTWSKQANVFRAPFSCVMANKAIAGTGDALRERCPARVLVISVTN